MKIIVRTFLIAAAIAAASASAQTNVFNSTGNAGVGTTSPAALLHLLKNGGDELVRLEAAAPFIYFKENDQAAPAGRWRLVADGGTFRLDRSTSSEFASYVTDFFISESGRVGVGTSAPSEKLTVNGDIRINTEPDGQAIKFVGRSIDGFNQLAFYNNAGSAFTGLLQYHGDGAIVFVNTAALAERMRIAPDGNVGIGTAAPIRALTIGHAASAEMVFQNAGRPADQRNYRIYSANGGLVFGTLNDAGSAGANHVVIDQASGNVAIGASAPGSSKLSVNGTIRAKEVIVDTGWADHVFAADYRLAPLSEVEQHIQQNGHLPDVPSATDVAERGVSVGEMQRILLQKIEELTLHVIKQEKRIRFLESENTRLKDGN